MWLELALLTRIQGTCSSPQVGPSLSQKSLLEQWALGLVNRGAEGVIQAGIGVWWPCVWVSPLMNLHILVFFLQGGHGRWLLWGEGARH